MEAPPSEFQNHADRYRQLRGTQLSSNNGLMPKSVERMQASAGRGRDRTCRRNRSRRFLVVANITAPGFLTPPRRDSGRGRRAHQDDSPYQRRWSPGDVVQLLVLVLPQVVEANPRVADSWESCNPARTTD